MARSALFAVWTGLVAFSGPSVASATPVLDQLNDPPANAVATVSGNDFAQTFTVGLTGTLTEVDVKITTETRFLLFFTTTDLHYDIRSTSLRKPFDNSNNTNVPDFTNPRILAEGTLSASNVPFAPNVGAFVSLPLGPGGIAVTAGEVLAIVLHIPDPASAFLFYDWFGAVNDPYDGGELFSTNAGLPDWFLDEGVEGSNFFFEPQFRTDLAFRTFVEQGVVPEPTSLTLLGFGIACLAATRRRR